MALLQCPSGPQDTTWCPKTTDDALPTVLGLLPPGPAWEGGRVEGTFQNQYWRGFSNLLGYTYGRLCDYVDEFYCATVKESRDQWIAEYGLNDPCDPYGYNLCIKVAAEGGATCDYFVRMAELSGYVLTCHDTSKDPEPISGCFEVGCTSLGPTPTYVPLGSRLGYGQHGACAYGEVVHHPEPPFWENGFTADAQCAVPGSNLGEGPDEHESCCLIVGYYDFDKPEVAVESDYCQNMNTTITFECPRDNVPADTTPCPTRREIDTYDQTGNYIEWGNAYTWEVQVDIAASRAVPDNGTPVEEDDSPMSAAGCFMAGNVPLLPLGEYGGTPLCADTTVDKYQPAFVLCFLDRIKPAHTTLNVKVIQP